MGVRVKGAVGSEVGEVICGARWRVMEYKRYMVHIIVKVAGR